MKAISVGGVAPSEATIKDGSIYSGWPRNGDFTDRWNGDRGNNGYGLCPDRAESGRDRCRADDNAFGRWNPAGLRSPDNYADRITDR